MPDLSPEAEKLLAVKSEDFVSARTKLARQLRDADRRDDAKAVAELRKPSQVVLAVNRAARDRPQAAKDAAKAAERLGRTQLSGTPDEYASLLAQMETASRLLGDVALANLSKRGAASESMRRRVVDHLRGSLSTEDTRALLVRGALTDEIAPAGFDAFAGLPIPRTRARPDRANAGVGERAQQAREKKLRDEITRARRELSDAEKRVRDATRTRDELAKHLQALEARRDVSA